MIRRTGTSIACIAAYFIATCCAFLNAQSLTHVRQIDIFDHFNSTSELGDNPLSVVFDGANAYIGGYNNSDTDGDVGLLKIDDVLGNATLTPLPSSVQNTSLFSGYNELEYEPTTGDIYANIDKGSANLAGNLVQRRSHVDGSLVWSINPFSDTAAGTQRVKAMAVDTFDAVNSPFLATIAANNGRRMGLSLADGSTIYGPTGTASPGGIILGNVNGTDDFGTNWLAMAMDAAGNLSTIEQDFVGYTTRTGDNTFQAPSGVAERQDEILRKPVTQASPGEDIVIMQDLLGPEADVLAVSVRIVTALQQLDGTTQMIDSNRVLLRNLDGSTTGLTQTELTGGEDGIGTAFDTDLKSLAYGRDGQGNPTLLVVDYLGRTLDIYQQLQSPICDFDGNGLCDISDINELLAVGDLTVGVIGADEKYDLNGDNIVNGLDLDLWLAAAGAENGLSSPYKRGDADLSGAVDVSDFNSWNSNKFTSVDQWDLGDFNGDGTTDVSDFNIWNGNKFTASDGLPVAVPEPAGMLLLTSCLLAALYRRYSL